MHFLEGKYLNSNSNFIGNICASLSLNELMPAMLNVYCMMPLSQSLVTEGSELWLLIVWCLYGARTSAIIMMAFNMWIWKICSKLFIMSRFVLGLLKYWCSNIWYFFTTELLPELICLWKTQQEMFNSVVFGCRNWYSGMTVWPTLC